MFYTGGKPVGKRIKLEFPVWVEKQGVTASDFVMSLYFSSGSPPQKKNHHWEFFIGFFVSSGKRSRKCGIVMMGVGIADW